MHKNKRITISNDTLIFIWFLIKADIPQNQALSREGAHYISLMAACVALMYGRGTFPCYADRGCAFSFSSHRAMQRIVGIAIEAEIPIKAVL